MTDPEIESAFTCADPDKPTTLRCKICYVGFSGENTVERAVNHIRNKHRETIEELKNGRSENQIDG